MEKKSSKGIRIAYFVLPVVLYAVAIFYVSSLEKISIPEIGIELEDKLSHLFAYFLFGWLMIRALHFGKQEPVSFPLMALAIALSFLYGLSDELHQYFVPGRSCEFWDWLADAIGILIGTEFYRRTYRVEQSLYHYAAKTIIR